MNVIGYDPVLSEDFAKKIGVALVDQNIIFELSDIITFHFPLTY